MKLAPHIEHYLTALYPEPHPVVLEMEERARKTSFPIVGRLVGELLAWLTQMIQARTVFEVGSGFGYSAYFFARELPPDGKVILTDHSDDNLNLARNYLQKAGLSDRSILLTGDGFHHLINYAKPVDIIFLDAEKKRYPEILPLAEEKLRVGGLLIADNTLWHGKVADPSLHDADTEGIRRFNQMVLRSMTYRTYIFPIRDGLLVAYKSVIHR